jgi:hypothetical protein|tara:strand:- start:98 stop:367 length:270 start_codon:yes stop_codon:yes gene_type:complete
VTQVALCVGAGIHFKSERMSMEASEWVGLLAIAVGLSGSIVGWMIRISRQLARIENAVDRMSVIESDMKETKVHVAKNTERISILEAAR